MIRAVADRIVVYNMHFGEQTTQSGIFISNDDGKTRGIHPRWAQVHSIGPSVDCEYTVGDWVLIEHGRWTRKFEGDLRMVDSECVLMFAYEKPSGVQLGSEYGNGEEVSV